MPEKTYVNFFSSSVPESCFKCAWSSYFFFQAKNNMDTHSFPGDNQKHPIKANYRFFFQLKTLRIRKTTSTTKKNIN